MKGYQHCILKVKIHLNDDGGPPSLQITCPQIDRAEKEYDFITNVFDTSAASYTLLNMEGHIHILLNFLNPFC